jgi:hypothetical protein
MPIAANSRPRTQSTPLWQLQNCATPLGSTDHPDLDDNTKDIADRRQRHIGGSAREYQELIGPLAIPATAKLACG